MRHPLAAARRLRGTHPQPAPVAAAVVPRARRDRAGVAPRRARDRLHRAWSKTGSTRAHRRAGGGGRATTTRSRRSPRASTRAEHALYPVAVRLAPQSRGASKDAARLRRDGGLAWLTARRSNDRVRRGRHARPRALRMDERHARRTRPCRERRTLRFDAARTTPSPNASRQRCRRAALAPGRATRATLAAAACRSLRAEALAQHNFLWGVPAEGARDARRAAVHWTARRVREQRRQPAPNSYSKPAACAMARVRDRLARRPASRSSTRASSVALDRMGVAPERALYVGDIRSVSTPPAPRSTRGYTSCSSIRRGTTPRRACITSRPSPDCRSSCERRSRFRHRGDRAAVSGPVPPGRPSREAAEGGTMKTPPTDPHRSRTAPAFARHGRGLRPGLDARGGAAGAQRLRGGLITS